MSSTNTQSELIPRITFANPAWQTTFPNRITPFPDEWLSGLLLRCDEVNQWPSGVTSSYLLHASTWNASNPTISFLVPPPWLFEELAEVLAMPVPLLLASTYLPELTQIYGFSKILHPTLLNSSFFFRFCPACVQNRLLKRTLMLAHIAFCPLHHVMLCQQCPCGVPQRLFYQHSRPFTCRSCGLDWADFPKIAVSPEEMVVEGKILAWYELFLSQGTPSVTAKALKLIHDRFPMKGTGGVQLLDGKMHFALPDSRGGISLGYLVDWLVSLHLLPEELTNEGNYTHLLH